MTTFRQTLKGEKIYAIKSIKGDTIHGIGIFKTEDAAHFVLFALHNTYSEADFAMFEVEVLGVENNRPIVKEILTQVVWNQEDFPVTPKNKIN